MLVSQLPHHPPVTLEFNSLHYSVVDSEYATVGGFTGFAGKRMKPILKGVSGTFRPGELTAIMGPSGAGKSTLMNVLAGSKTFNVQGSISVNGKPRELTQFRKMSCYIMQDDVLLPHLTVGESMKFAAQLKLPKRTSKNEKEAIIGEILEIIGLANCVDVKASSISGGQRKRLAIALELINNPPIMFFDEPTSGLDSSTCFSCVTLLKSLAQQGRTIIATIHQPSARIFEQFDSLYLLGGGECLYRGMTSGVIPFLAGQGLECPAYHNVADFVLEVANGDYGEDWIRKLVKASADTLPDSEDYSDRSSGGTSITPPDKPKIYKPEVSDTNYEKDVGVTLIESNDSFKSVLEDSRLEQLTTEFLTLTKRSFLCISRDMMQTHLRFASTIVIGLIVGTIYHGVGKNAEKQFNNVFNLFFGLFFMIFSSLLATVTTFPLERGVLLREHLNCWYSLKSYFLANTFAEIPFQLFYPFLYVTIMYYMTDQPQDAFRFWIVVWMHIATSMVATSVGLLTGAVLHVKNAVFVAPIITIPVILFAGFFCTIKSIPPYLAWVSWFSYMRYSFQSTLTAVYGFDRKDYDCHEAYCHFKNPVKVLEQIDAVNVDVVAQSMCLVGLIVVTRVLSYFALKFKVIMEKQ